MVSLGCMMLVDCEHLLCDTKQKLGSIMKFQVLINAHDQ